MLKQLKQWLPEDIAVAIAQVIPLLLVLALFIAAFAGLRRWSRHHSARSDQFRYRIQAYYFVWSTTLVLAILIFAPMHDELRGQLLSLFGIVLSATIALSSTTVMGNVMAGVMLRFMHSFQIGDYVRIEGKLGRVSGVSFLHVEVQTEYSDLLTIPNLVFVQKPFEVVAQKGAVIHAEVSLGYEVHRHRAEMALLDALPLSGMEDGFVQIKQLGDFSVVYSLHARLEEAKKLVSSKSRLQAAMLDSLHAHGIEIVSPNFMNQRALDPAVPVIPKEFRADDDFDEEGDWDEQIDEMLFAKAEQATIVKRLRRRLEATRKRVESVEAEMQQNEKDSEKYEQLKVKLELWQRREKQVQELIDKQSL